MKKKKSVKKARKKERKERHMMIVKRKGHGELYDERKVYGSCYFACRNAHLGEIEAEVISNQVTKAITKAVKQKKNVTSDEIFKMLVQELKKFNDDASFLYETHRDIS